MDIESAPHIDEAQSIFQKRILPVTLKFQDLVYKIRINEGRKSWLQMKNTGEPEKVILNGVTGMVQPGEMLALLGPSGSGKTTLLSALGGRLGGQLDGSILYNGKLLSNAMKRVTGFVTQDDVLYPHLTVTETLVFTALLRLPNTLTKEEKVLQAESVITQLELTRCKNSFIGDEFFRGVSGGERKRVSIGQELLVNPSVLILDEPTSGLDSTTALRIVSLLSELANAGRTVVMTIHQPSSRLFYMFHKVLLLSEGNLLYFGKVSAVMDYFSDIGFKPSVPTNPADFLLDLANGLKPDGSHENKSLIQQTIVLAYNENLSDNLKAELAETKYYQQLNDKLSAEDKNFGGWPTTWWQQFSVLFSRGLRERKHESFSAFKIGEVLAISLLCGLLWWRLPISQLQDQIGFFFFMCGFWGFFPLLEAIATFPQERKMLEKERSSGTYRLSSYFISRMVTDLPMELVLPTLFLTVVYWMTGLKHTAGHFFLALIILLLNVLVSHGFGLALGALVMNQQLTATLGSIFMLSFLLAGGFFVTHMPSFISWVKYLSFSHYTFKLFIGSQFASSDTYSCDTNQLCSVADFPTIKMVGLGEPSGAIGVLLLMLVGFRLLAYMALMRIGVTK